MSSLFQQNLEVLSTRYPDLPQWLEQAPDREALRMMRSRDGSVFYAVSKNGQAYPLTDPVAPMAKLQQQLDRFAGQLQDFTRPILVVGFYPGNELLYLFDLSEKVTTPHAEQHIWVILDSPLCLLGFLQSWDARRVLESPRVHFVRHDHVPAMVEHLTAHPEIPHVFTLISNAREETLQRVLVPLGDLIVTRDGEMERLREENNRYYDAVSDDRLAQIISGKADRPPRILIPTVTWSTFIQHSARDIAEAFTDLGWEAKVLKMDTMITPYYLVWRINEFKPDVFLFIDHLRYEAEEVYPRNMMFVTWIQDEMNHIQCLEAGRKLAEYAAQRKRDLVIGHTAGLDIKFDYPTDRLLPISVPADPRIFHPITLTPDQEEQYGCDMAFMSNVSRSSERVVEEVVIPLVASWGISRQTTMDVHDRLWRDYRAGLAYVRKDELTGVLLNYPEIQSAWGPDTGALSDEQSNRREELLRLFYWRLNDTIFRHVVLEWADELGLNMHLYGRGWEHHPRFAKYARGVVAHGAELNAAYQGARLNLHLNITPGMHQRLWEITSAGATPFMRVAPPLPGQVHPPIEAMRKLAQSILAGHTVDLPDEAQEWIFDRIWALAQTEVMGSDAERVDAIWKKIENVILSRPAWIVPNWDNAHFLGKEDFEEKVRALLGSPVSLHPNPLSVVARDGKGMVNVVVE